MTICACVKMQRSHNGGNSIKTRIVRLTVQAHWPNGPASPSLALAMRPLAYVLVN